MVRLRNPKTGEEIEVTAKAARVGYAGWEPLTSIPQTVFPALPSYPPAPNPKRPMPDIMSS
jgi:hypothetical protein